MLRVALCFIILGVLPWQGLAQKMLWLRVEPNAAWNRGIGKTIQIDSIQQASEAAEVLMELYASGYFLASADQIRSGDTLFMQLHPGAKYQLRELRMGNVPEEWYAESGLRYFRNAVVWDGPRLRTSMERLLQLAENNGYPFASVKLDSVLADSHSVNAAVSLQLNEIFYFDSLGMGGNAQIKPLFLQQYCGIKPGAIYNESIVKSLGARLSELPYVTVVRDPGVYFSGNTAKPYVYINHRKASSFDGVIGFAPQSAVNNKLVITGDLDLKLANLLGTGKQVELLYRGYLSRSQDLQVKLLWPYFFKTKLALDYTFRLAKYDTTWTELFNDIGLQYRFSGSNYVKAFYQSQQVFVLQPDTLPVSLSAKLPQVQDVRNNLYGLALRWSSLDYFFNPTRGWLIELDAGAGVRQLVKNQTLDAVVLKNGKGESYSVYDSVKMTTVRYKAGADVSWYRKVSGNMVLKTQLKGAIVQADPLFQNELFRIGGLKTLRGFDEQRIFASRYLIGNLELRYLFQRNSAFLLFWNGAWYRNDALLSSASDKPWGLGAGMFLETGAGIFSLYYAVGAERGNSPDLQRARIHFGLVNYF